ARMEKPMITLFNATMSRSTRVLWLLEELDAEYALVPVSIRRPDGSAGPDPANPHPLGQVPCILDDGELIVESLAIWIHLADSFPDPELAPPPDHFKRAEYVGWLGLATCVFEPLVTATLAGAPLDERQQAARTFLSDRVATALDCHGWLLWDRFSVVDLVYGSLLRFAPAALGPSPQIEAWLERMSGRPALARVRQREGRT
ncbi:MAG: glutathione S-transferase family protein, partial [Pseudomonadota bacterium]|nr:glutathione S-transferase family protein [Pseudomonadota bacterium]